MEKSQYELCTEVLPRLDKAGILENVVLVGSWCTLFYKEFFGRTSYKVSFITRDMDLLIPRPSAISKTINTAFIERHNGTDRNRNARKRPRQRCNLRCHWARSKKNLALKKWVRITEFTTL